MVDMLSRVSSFGFVQEHERHRKWQLAVHGLD
jgi:hypothetical protein